MAIRFVERDAARDRPIEENAAPDAPRVDAAPARPGRSSTEAAGRGDAAPPTNQEDDATAGEAEAAPADPGPGADGLLPGLVEPARPRRRRRGRMMGFG